MPSPMPVIVGVPRSGTTLLRMMLDAHPAMAIPPETGFLPSLADLAPLTESCLEADQIITSSHTWPDFQLEASALRATLCRTPPSCPADVARAFYCLYAARFGKPRWGDKTPTYGAELDRIAALLPEARFIHLIRDGRDVTLSVRPLWFRPGDSVEACATDWAARVARTRLLSSRIENYLEIRYESLVESPGQTLSTVCTFLDLPFEPQMLRYYLRAGARLDEHQARYSADGRELISKAARLYNQRLVMTPPCPDRIARWKTEMTDDEVMRFEAVAGEWLERLGYGLGTRSV